MWGAGVGAQSSVLGPQDTWLSTLAAMAREVEPTVVCVSTKWDETKDGGR